MADSSRQHLISSKDITSMQSPVSAEAAYSKSVQNKASGPQLPKGAFQPVDVGLPDASESLRVPDHQRTMPCGGCRDWVFVILFLLAIAGYCVVVALSVVRGPTPNSILGLECQSHASCFGVDAGDMYHLIRNLFIVAGICGATALILSSFLVCATFASAKWTGIIAIGIVACYAVALSVWGFMQGSYVTGIVGIVLFLLELWTLYNFFIYEKFATVLVGMTRAATKSYVGNWFVGAITAVLLCAWCVGWNYSAYFVLSAWTGWQSYLTLIFALFMFYWIAEAIKNVGHCAIAGSVAHWYFVGPGISKNPTWGSFVRATTLSFGSILFGSLLVAILQTLRRIFQMLRVRGSRHWLAVLLSVIARLFLIVIEALLRFFNTYAFALIAIYGVSYCEAARKVKKLFGEHGFEMVMQNNVVVSIIVASSLVVGGACAGIAYALVQPLGLTSAPILTVVVGALLGLFVVDGCFIVVFSGSVSILTCFICSPDVIRQRNPQLALMLDQSYANFSTKTVQQK